MKSLITIICGPTASGKSALAVDLARRDNGVIINADSMQIYDALPILTARPSEQEQQNIPHRLYAMLDPTKTCSAQAWRDMALPEIESALAKNQHPVVVGGTGLYLKTLVYGLSPMPKISATIRMKANARQAELGNPAFHAELQNRDPVMAARLNPNDTQRLIRAWEVFEATGESLATWQAMPLQGPPPGWRFRIIVKSPPREKLHQYCDQRFESMLELGAMEEVAALKSLIRSGSVPVEASITHALGFRALSQMQDGLINREQAVALAKAETRQYAKRQDTWFRHQMRPVPHIEDIIRVP